MKRAPVLILMFGLALVFVACVPAVQPVPDRQGQSVIITIEPHQTVYSAVLSVINATTDDERCTVINETDVGCTLGTLEAGVETVVTVQGEPGKVHCWITGFTDPDLDIKSYRPYMCKV